MGIEWAESVVLGRTLYLWVPGNPGRPAAPQAFLAYRISEDRWQRLPLPRHADRLQGFARAGSQLVAYSRSDERGEHPDLLFDPGSQSWTELPADPLSPSFDRYMASSGHELLLFEHELVSNPGSDRPAVTRAAAYDLAAQTWRRLPDSEILGSSPWFAVSDLLVNPVLGGADGGEVGGWGRTYPYGGILDPESGDWSALANPPTGDEAFGSGVLTASGGHYFGYAGWILDATTHTWIEIPSLDGGELVTGRTVVAVGTDLLVFGGVAWVEADGELLDEAWAWSPPLRLAAGPHPPLI